MAELETRVSDLERNVDRVMTKLDMFIAESREARQRHDAEIREIRQRQDAAQAKHEADMREIRQRQEAAQAKHDADIQKIHERQEAAQAKHDADMREMQKNLYAKMDNMDTKIEGIGNHVRNITIAAMVGIGAAVTGVAAMVVAVFLK